MNILYLKYAVEIEKEGSVKKAAQKLFMGQPNLSRAIKELETSLGITIFERSAKGMTVTPEGDEFLRYARKILAQIDEVEKLYTTGRKTKQRFSLSAPRASYVADAFSKFSKLIDPQPAELFYHETDSMHTINNVLHKEYKLGIIRYAENFDKYYKAMLEEKKLAYEMITDFQYVLIMHKNSPLSQMEEISFSDLEGYMEIAHADPLVPSLPLSEVKKSEMPTSSRRIFVVERASQFELLSQNPQIYMWVSPIPTPLLERYQLVQRECTDIHKIYKDVLIYQENYKLSKLDHLFINELLKSKRKYLKIT